MSRVARAQSHRDTRLASFSRGSPCLLLFRNPRDSAREGDDSCTAVQWVVHPKSPCALSGHRVGMDLLWSGKISIFQYVQMSPRQGKQCPGTAHGARTWHQLIPPSVRRSSRRSHCLQISCAHTRTGCSQDIPLVGKPMEKCTCIQKYLRVEVNLQDFFLLWEVPSQFIVISVISSLLQKMHNMFGPKSKIRL